MAGGGQLRGTASFVARPVDAQDIPSSSLATTKAPKPRWRVKDGRRASKGQQRASMHRAWGGVQTRPVDQQANSAAGPRVSRRAVADAADQAHEAVGAELLGCEYTGGEIRALAAAPKLGTGDIHHSVRATGPGNWEQPRRLAPSFEVCQTVAEWLPS